MKIHPSHSETRSRNRGSGSVGALEGRIEVRYEDDGTFTHVQRFAYVPLMLTEEPVAIGQAQCEIQVPLELGPSCETAEGAVIWALKFKGIVPGHVDLRDEFIVRVESNEQTFVPPIPLRAFLSEGWRNDPSVTNQSKRRDWRPKVVD